MGFFTILFLDSFPRKMEICHQNSSIYIHTVVYVHSVPHLLEKAPPFKSQAHYIPSAFWLFSFNEFCAVHYCSNKKTWKRICCWLITCAKNQKGTRLKVKKIYPFKEENNNLKMFYPNVQHCYYKSEIMYVFEHWVHAYMCVSVCNVWICQHHR